ncbi:MAG: hypothetical protein D6703_07050 [Zetaproteobacteria bacterium]|nr:MAG: hypothetical protein D6703_07050 [Zetaproteobacteria bacterium]
MRVHWADFRIPPINLWVMPTWPEDPGRQAPGQNSSPLRVHTNTITVQQKIRSLLAARGGYHGHQN